jgi:hypothetical protein
MKALPCSTCKSSARLPNGQVYVVGRLSHFPHLVPCSKCGRKTTVTVKDFSKLPDLTPEALEEMGLLETYQRDLVGAGYAPHEVSDLFRAGWSPAQLHALGEAPPRAEG